MTRFTLLSLLAAALLLLSNSAQAQDKVSKTEIRGVTHGEARIASNLKIKKAGSNIKSAKIAPGPSLNLFSTVKKSAKSQKSSTTCQNAFQKQVKRHQANIRYCYDKMLRTQKQEGTLKVRVRSKSGQVQAVSFKGSNIKNQKLETCVEKNIKRWTLPQSCSSSFSTSWDRKPQCLASARSVCRVRVLFDA